jgi:RNA polymerase sigma-70 factor (sigma-E family)
VTFDEWAQARLPALLRFAVALTGDRGLGEDVVQEVLIRAYGRWSRIAALDQPEAYLRRMVTNEYLSWRRRWARVTPHADVPAEPGAGPAPDHADAHADRSALAVELARLPRRQRAVLVLRYYEHLTDAEIADVLQCPQGTVRSLASRALRTLRVDARDRLLVRERS